MLSTSIINITEATITTIASTTAKMKEAKESHRQLDITHILRTYWVVWALLVMGICGGLIILAIYCYHKCRECPCWKFRGRDVGSGMSPSDIEFVERKPPSASSPLNSEQAINIYGSERSVTPRNLRALPGKLESLTRLILGASTESRALPPSREPENYAYTPLEPENTDIESEEADRKARTEAHGICDQFLKSNPRYNFISHLNDIGSRLEKHWFIVRDNMMRTERILTLLPHMPGCPVEINPRTKDVIVELFLALQHPYIYPILDIAFRDSGDQSYAFITFPLSLKGSLKDIIYRSQWEEDWSKKYVRKSTGLPLVQIQRIGRQILEALLFLRRKGFPPSGHFHSGNIILQNGMARLTGLENALFGFTSRTHPILWATAQAEPSGLDSVCFGHVLFEMSAGYELQTPRPTTANMLDLYHYPQVVDVLEFIFDNPEERFPTIEELILRDFFRNIDLREIRNMAQTTKFFQTVITQQGYELLEEMRKYQIEQLKKLEEKVVFYVEDETKMKRKYKPKISKNNSCCSFKGEDVEENAEVEQEDKEEGACALPICPPPPPKREHRSLGPQISPIKKTVRNYSEDAL